MLSIYPGRYIYLGKESEVPEKESQLLWLGEAKEKERKPVNSFQTWRVNLDTSVQGSSLKLWLESGSAVTSGLEIARLQCETE